MAQCIRCGKETELYEAGVPICPACIDQRERKRCCKKHLPPDSRKSETE